MSPPKNFTLTAVDVDVKIAGVDTGAQGSGIVVSELTVTFRVNDFSEASISLGYSTTAGLKKLLQLFPKEGSEGAYFSVVEVYLKDGGPLSYLRGGGLPWFKGRIVGFSHKKQVGQIAFVVNAFGGPYLLGQVLMGAPGMHPGAPESWGVDTWTGTQAGEGGTQAESNASVLIAELRDRSSVLEIFKTVMEFITNRWDSSFSAIGSGSSIAYEAARAAYGLGSESKVKLTEELDTIEDLSGANNFIYTNATKNAAIYDVTHTAFASAHLSIWHYFLGVLDAYGLDMICLGEKCFVIAKSPLADPIKTNIIAAEGSTYQDIRDFSFEAPTRCIVTVRDQLLTDASDQALKEVGVYPPTIDLSSQEAKTGVKTIKVEVPAFMAYMLENNRAAVMDKTKTKKVQGGKVKREDVKKEAADTKKQINEMQAQSSNIFTLYAQYILMKRKFRQRTGMVVTKFDPYLLPGFVGRVVDPILANGTPIATMDGLFSEITHNLSYQRPIAQTTVAMTHVRYLGELKDAKLKTNPIYPDYVPQDAASAARDNGFGI